MRNAFARLWLWIADTEAAWARHVTRGQKPGEPCNFCGNRIGARDCTTCGRRAEPGTL